MSGGFVLCFSLFLLQVASSVSTESTDVLDGSESVPAVREDHEVCQTVACHRTATEILNGMDKNTEPCVDFYNFICKNWREHNPDLVGVNIRNQFLNAQLNHFDRMRELLEGPEEEDETDGFKLARQIYDTCKADDRSSYIKQTNILVNIINEAGEWPLLNGTRYIKKNIWQEIDMFFMKKYSKSWMYDLTVLPDNFKKHDYVLTITPPKILRPSFMKVNSAKNTMKYINLITQVILNIVRPDKYHTLGILRLHKDIMDMIKLEDRLIAASSPSDEFCDFREMTLQMMQDLFRDTKEMTQIDWVTRFKMFLDINTEQPVYVTCARHIEQLFHIIDSTDEHIIVNYIFWRFVVHTFPRVIEGLRNAFYEGDSSKPRYVQCIEQNEALSSIHYRVLEKDFSRKQIKQAADVYEAVDSVGSWTFLAFKDRLGESPTRLNAYNLHETKPLEFINPTLYFNETDHKARFRSEDVKSTHIENIIAGMLYQHQTDINRIYPDAIKVPSPTTYTPLEVIIRGGAFSKERYVPAAAIQFPFYHHDRPQSLNYGAFGSIAGYSVMKEYYDYLIAAYRGDSRVGSMSKATRESFKSHSQITLEKWDEYPLKRKAVKDAVELDMIKKFEHNAESDALRAAYTGYMRDFETRGWKDVRLPGLEEYNHEQLFFISYVNAHCVAPNRMGHTSVQDLSEAVISDLDLEARRKVILSLLETKEFGEAFGCPRGSWMYPVKNEPFWFKSMRP